MMRSIHRASRGWLTCGLAGAIFLLGNAISEAQTRSTTGGGSTLTGRNSSSLGGQGSSGIGGQGSVGQGTNFGQTPTFGNNSASGFAGNTLQQSFKLRSNTSSNIGVGGPIGQYYNNPLALGLPTSNSRGGFGTPLFSNTGGTTTGGFGGIGGTTGSFGGTGGTRTGTTGGIGGSTGSFGGTTGTLGGGTTGSRGIGTTTGGGFGGTGGAGLGGTATGLGGTRTGLGGTGATGLGGTGTGLTGGRTGQGGLGGGLTGGLTGGFGNTFGATGGTLGGRTGTLGGTSSLAGSGRRSAPYIVEVATPAPRSPAMATRFSAELQGVLARSTSLPSVRSIQVGTDGPVVVLRGKVATERERELAEALLRITPGVREISNELQVEEEAPPPRPIP